MQTLVERLRSAQIDLRRLREGWRPAEADLEDAVGLEEWIPGVVNRPGFVGGSNS